MAANEHDLN